MVSLTQFSPLDNLHSNQPTRLGELEVRIGQATAELMGRLAVFDIIIIVVIIIIKVVRPRQRGRSRQGEGSAARRCPHSSGRKIPRSLKKQLNMNNDNDGFTFAG